MEIKAIIGRVFPARVNRVNDKARAVAVTKAELELADKRTALSAFLRNESLQTKDFGQSIGDEELTNLKISDLMKLFGNNLTKIKKLLGAYGLAEYAQVSPQTVMKNGCSNVTEHGYSKNKPVKYAFCGYLLKNDTGSIEDIQERFGEGGKFLLKKYINRGLIRISDNGGYHVPTERRYNVALTVGGNEGAFKNIDSYDRYRYYRFDEW